MSVIIRNDYGAVGVNKSVIEKMIIEELLSLKSVLILCNKKGRPIKEKRTPRITPEHYDSIDVSEKRGDISVKINVIVRHGNNISELADGILDSIEGLFDLLRLNKPSSISIKVRGIMSDELSKRNIEIVRKNA